MGRVYEDDKTLVLAKSHGFFTIPLKKILNPIGSTINNFTNNAIISNNISFV